MVKRYVISTITNNALTITHFGEEDNAVLSPAKPHQRADFIIHIVLDGKGTYQTRNNQRITENDLSKNMAFAIYKYDTVYYKSNKEEPMHYFWIAFNGDESEKILNYIGFSRQNPIINLSDSQKVFEGFNQLFQALEHKEKYPLFAAFFNFITILKNNNISSANLSHDDDDTIFTKAIEYIKANICNNIKVADLVEYLHVDQSHFTKCFKKHFNELPHSYITKSRLQYAEFFIKTTNKTISDISALLNFTDVYSFSKLFKKEYGVSPLSYRKLILNEQNTLKK